MWGVYLVGRSKGFGDFPWAAYGLLSMGCCCCRWARYGLHVHTYAHARTHTPRTRTRTSHMSMCTHT